MLNPAVEILVKLAVKAANPVWKGVSVKSNCFISLFAIVIELCAGLPIAILHCKQREAGRVF